MRPIKIKIDVTKLDKGLFFKAKSGAIYADLVAFPLRSPGQYGDTHIVKQDQKSDDERDLPIIGNLTLPDDSPPPQQQWQDDEEEEEEIPF